MLWFLLGLALPGRALGAEMKITNISEFIEFTGNVNKGTNYQGTTVFLDSDLDFTGETFVPIGTSYYFSGTFDAQGHVISNLELASSLQYVGLFGYSRGLTIRNVILDSSCSITSSGSGYAGGIIGWCETSNGPCSIENSVNMGSVTFSGYISSYSLCLGGIAGYLSSSGYDSTVKNCANYGDVTHSGESRNSYIGGIVGHSYGPSKTVYIYNSLNYGTITHNDITSNYLYLGGIAGWADYTTIENCVSGGKISSSKTSYIGSIVGHVNSGTSITHCFWTSDLSDYDVSGSGSPTTSNTSFIVSLNTTISGLNDYAEKNSTWSRWVLIHLNGGVINSLSQGTPIGGLLKSLPVPTKDGYTPLYWYINEGCTETYDPETTEANKITDLYVCWSISNYTVTFDGNGGDVNGEEIMNVTYDSTYGDLPTAERYGYDFAGWFTEVEGGEEVKSEDVVKITEDQTIYAHWTINQYTITFEVDGGSECEKITQDYSTTIVLPEPTKTGYTFVHWCSDSELSSEYTETTMPAENVTLYAKWSINKYNLTFIFNNGAENEVRILDFNEEIPYPAKPMKEGHTFNGWDNNITFMPAHNLTITAQWTINQYTLTLIFNDETEPEVRHIAFNTPIELPKNPTRDEFTFAGWFEDEDLSIPFNTIHMPAHDITLYAKWNSTDTWVPVTLITNASDFELFARSVKHLNGYCGLTVFIKRNIDLSSITPFEPIDGFCGTLDGQGHKVSNLHIRSTRKHVGLFGTTEKGAAVRNIALDSVCLIMKDNNDNKINKRSSRGTIY